MRIQIVDHERRSMFPLGSARLEDFGSGILKELAHIVSSVPNRISISGHGREALYRGELHELGSSRRTARTRRAAH